MTGTNFFPSRALSCPSCSTRTVTVKGEEVTEYYHRGVAAHLIGHDLALPLDAELHHPAEGETRAAARLANRVVDEYGRFVDAFAGDGLYFEAPFINACLARRKHVIFVIKGEHRLLQQDALGLFRSMPPGVWEAPDRTVRYWDEDGFGEDGVHVPIRVMRTKETVRTRKRVGHKWVEKIEEQQWMWGTTIPKSQLPTRALWEIGHGRWDIENDLFNDLASHWSLDHCFIHDPVAILNLILTLFIAFVLLQTFHHRHLKTQRRALFTLMAVAEEIHLGLTDPGFRAAWLIMKPGPSP